MRTKVMQFKDAKVGDIFQWGDSPYNPTGELHMKVNVHKLECFGYVYLAYPGNTMVGSVFLAKDRDRMEASIRVIYL